MDVVVGSPAPEFALPAGDGSTVSLSALRGSTVVLYFYPKDDTSGCTAEACSFRDNLGRLEGLGVRVVGVSPDGVKSHAKFAEKYSLPFALLADTDQAVCKAYGVWVEKSMYGRQYMGVERSTFVIDRDGVVRAAFRKVKVTGHADEVIRTIEEL